MYSLLLGVVALAAHVSFASAHAFMFNPPQRGLLNGASAVDLPVVDPKAPIDWSPHFPAGDKAQEPGSGLRSQKAAAGPKGWTPFEPTQPGFVWRAGVCGDLKNGNDHLRGGKYYFGGKIVATYDQGGIVDVDVAVVTHHNGYMELHVCDVIRCNGEVSENCFRKGACVRLNRTLDRSCESRTDQLCSPRDPRHPSRWYLPCSHGGVDLFGSGKMRFRLPPRLSCRHCVLHWYYVAANYCNPPGVTAFFEGPRGPKWGDCEGEGDAIGGYRRWPQVCGGHRLPEEFYQCADIRIRKLRGKSKAQQRLTPPSGRRYWLTS